MSTDGRVDTWAMWKSDVIGLSDADLHAYLEGVEGYTPEQVAAFVAGGSTIQPDDWTPTDASRAAVRRFFAFKQKARAGGDPGAALAGEEAREAALDPTSAATTIVGERDDAPADPKPPQAVPGAVESNASGYGAAALHADGDRPARP